VPEACHCCKGIKRDCCKEINIVLKDSLFSRANALIPQVLNILFFSASHQTASDDIRCLVDFFILARARWNVLATTPSTEGVEFWTTV